MQQLIWQKVIGKTVLAGMLFGYLPASAVVLHENNLRTGAQTASTATDELLALLPESDIVAVIDAQRAFTELLPKLKNISTGGIGKTAQEVETLTRLTGVEPKQIQAAVIGLKMTESLTRGSGVLLLQGIAVDGAKLTEAVKALGGELMTDDHQGKPLFTLSQKAKEDGSVEQVHFALLDNKRVAIGDLAALKGVLEGGAKNSKQAAFSLALKDAKATGLVRFAGNLPEGLRAMLASQGELFAQVAAVKAIFGSFDLNADNTATLDARLRTASKNEAVHLKESLDGLIVLGRAFLGDNEDPTMKLIGQLLDRVKISIQLSDVALLLQLPKEMMDKLK